MLPFEASLQWSFVELQHFKFGNRIWAFKSTCSITYRSFKHFKRVKITPQAHHEIPIIYLD